MGSNEHGKQAFWCPDCGLHLDVLKEQRVVDDQLGRPLDVGQCR